MLNFCFEPFNPDGKNAERIAESIRKRSTKNKNKLESLLKIRFSNTMISLKTEAVNDFPVISLQALKNEIFFGSFKLRLCRSYIVWNLRNNFYLNNIIFYSIIRTRFLILVYIIIYNSNSIIFRISN